MENLVASEDVLHSTLRPIFICLSCFGYYNPNFKSSLLRRMYDLYTLFSVSWCFFALSMLIRATKFVKGADVHSILIICGMFWNFQALFSALFSIYVFRTRKFDQIFRLWKSANLDKLILRRGILRVWKYFAIFAAFIFIFCMTLVLEVAVFQGYVDSGLTQIFALGIYVEIVQHVFTRAAWCLPAMIYFLLGLIFATTLHGLKKSIESNTEPLCSICYSITEQHFQISILIKKADSLFRFFVAVILASNVPTTILFIYSAVMYTDTSLRGTYLRTQVLLWAGSQLAQIFMTLLAAAFINHYSVQLYDVLYDQYIIYAKTTFEKVYDAAKQHSGPLSHTKTSFLMVTVDGNPVGSDQLAGSSVALQQINILLNRLANSNLGFTVWDLFTITRGSIVTTLSLVVSYFFLLLQFMVPPCGDCNCAGIGNCTVI